MNEIQLVLAVTKALNIKAESVQTTVKLLDEGATVPFISRYRREATGGMDEEQIRAIQEKVEYIRMLEERKTTILASIEEQGKLTDELKAKIVNCNQLQELEDLYLPYKPKRKTRATVAKAKGLEPLAQLMFDQQITTGTIEEYAQPFVNNELEVKTIDEAISGAKDIIAEWVGENAEIRKTIREMTLSSGTIISEQKDEDKKERTDYEMYYKFEEAISRIKPHHVLALNRGEKEEIIKVKVAIAEVLCIQAISNQIVKNEKCIFVQQIKDALADSYGRLIEPSIEREIRSTLTDSADLHAIEVFAKNLKNLLLQPPIFGKKIIGIDPGFVSGCKVAAVDETGKYLEGETIYPTEPRKWTDVSEKVIVSYVQKYKVDLIAIGNGTASREVEQFVVDTIKKYALNCNYLIVSEAGASVYSASKIAAEEFPELEAAQRGNISIARRVIDPLAELVKIDPKSIGVGLYQHDVNQKQLEHKLDQVVESCVNHVGVNLNTASISLLTHVSGLNKRIATKIVEFRDKIGHFKSREQLKEVSGVGENTFLQAAGFLKIDGGDNPLDSTAIHPESYNVTKKLLEKFSIDVQNVNRENEKLIQSIRTVKSEQLASELNVGVPTLQLILENLQKPGRDPREDMPKPILRSDILKIEDLKPGMKLKGTVRNVIDFGAFVDIGVKQDGLIHISEMGNSFVKNPHEVLAVGNIIDVYIKSVDMERKRIALSARPQDGSAPVPLTGSNSKSNQNYNNKQPRQEPQRIPENFESKLDLLKQRFGK